jgi:O-antigen/teichoic acid export membrane protein
LGGQQYAGTNAAIGANAATILRIFSIYGLLLPLDRMTGVGLDSVNRPEKNLIKVLFMVTANVIGDVVAIFLFHSLELVAVATVMFTLLGILLGYYYMNKEVPLHLKSIFTEGFRFYHSGYQRIRSHFNK